MKGVMLKVVLILILGVLIVPSSSYALGASGSWGCGDYNTAGWDAFVLTYSSAFPFNTILFAYNFFDAASSIAPVNPSGITYEVFGLTFSPFAWVFDSWFVDSVFYMLRYGVLLMIILGIAKKIVEVVL